MAVVSSPGKRFRNRLAIAAVVVATLIFLAPIYWIGSTAFKPRDVATSVPPTVFFQPETTAFVKLFTKRVQLREPVEPDVYAAAPWWEQRIFDGGERVLRVERRGAALGLSEPVPEQPDRRDDAAPCWRSAWAL